MTQLKYDTLGLLPALAADLFSNKEALYFKGSRWTFIEFSESVDRVAKALLALGIKPGNKVALWMMNCPEWLFIMYATAKIGAILVPLNTRYRSSDVAYAVNQSDSILWIFQASSGPVDFLSMVQSNVQSLPNKNFNKLKNLVVFSPTVHSDFLSWNDMLDAGKKINDAELYERSLNVNPEDTFLIAYTSGTTGDPKGVMHRHNLIQNTRDRIARLKITEHDVIINSLPLFHLYAYGEGAITSILTGARQVLMETFDASENLRLIEDEKVTIIHGFDTHYKDMMDEQTRNHKDISSLRLGTFPSGASNSIEIAKRTQNEFVKTVSGWGMTETWAFATVSSPEDTAEQRCEASGYPLPGIEVRIVDPQTRQEQPKGCQGELLIRSYMNMQGYYNKTEETKNAIDENGWLKTGDTALLRHDGHIRFLGRFKDMLKVGGENVSPLEVEAFLLEIPEIKQVAIVGYPDKRLHEIPVVFVVLNDKGSITIKNIEKHCRDKIAGFKIPRHLICVENFPMTPTGKVQKHILREQALRTLA